jgi:transposase InsO family protein
VPHGHARLTVHGRLLIVQRHQQGWKQAQIAAAMGVSRKCVKTWLGRHAAGGEAGLVDRSSRPRTAPTRADPQVEDRVLPARRTGRQGRLRLRPLSGRRPLPAGVLRGPARREGHDLRGLPGPVRGVLRHLRDHPHRASHDRQRWAYKHSLRAVCAELGVRQVFIKPHCPWPNGKAERFN